MKRSVTDVPLAHVSICHGHLNPKPSDPFSPSDPYSTQGVNQALDFGVTSVSLYFVSFLFPL